MTADELYRAVKNGQRSFVGCLIKDARLVGLDLGQFQFLRCTMRNADLRAVMGLEANFDGSDLTGADFSKSCLSHAKLNECILKGANLEGCNMKFAETTGADFTDANLTGVQRLPKDKPIAGWSAESGTLRKVVQ